MTRETVSVPRHLIDQLPAELWEGTRMAGLIQERADRIPARRFPQSEVAIKGRLKKYPAVILAYGIPEGYPYDAKPAVLLTRKGLMITQSVTLSYISANGGRVSIDVPEVDEKMRRATWQEALEHGWKALKTIDSMAELARRRRQR